MFVFFSRFVMVCGLEVLRKKNGSRQHLARQQAAGWICRFVGV